DVRLDADRPQFAHRVLRWFGLQFACARYERHQGQMDVDRLAARQIIAELTDRFEIGQALDIADGATDLAQNKVEIIVAVANEILDGIGDVRNNLDGRAEIIAAPLLGENFLIDSAGRNIVLACRRTARETLVMT